MNAEVLLTNLVGTELRESACDFSLTQKAGDVYAVVTRFRKISFEASRVFFAASQLLPSPP